MKRALKWLGIGLAGLVVAAFFLRNPISSRLLRAQVFEALHKTCPACNLEIRSLHVSLKTLGGASRVVAEGIRFRDNPNAGTVFDFEARKIEARVSFYSFFRGVADIPEVRVVGLHVTAKERSEPTPPHGPDFPPPGFPLEELPEARIGEIQLSDGAFTYDREVSGKQAKIELHALNGKVGSFATRARLLPKGPHLIRAEIAGQLERSGKARVRVAFDPFAAMNRDEVDIEVRGQKLAELNPFFSVDDRVTLSGTLRQGLATLVLRRGRLSGTLMTSYQDFRLKGPSAFKNFIRAITVQKSRPDNPASFPPHSAVSAQRRPHEAVTKLILRGLKAAADRILTS